jgi:hypothetical protein
MTIVSAGPLEFPSSTGAVSFHASQEPHPHIRYRFRYDRKTRTGNPSHWLRVKSACATKMRVGTNGNCASDFPVVACIHGKFVVPAVGEAYDARINRPNRQF